MTSNDRKWRREDLKHRIETLPEMIQATTQDDLRELLSEMLADAERALADLEREPDGPNPPS